MRRGNGDGGIFKLSGKRKNPFAVRITKGWTKDGKQIFEYIGYFKNKTEAKKHLNNYLLNPYDLSNDKITAQQVFDEWEKTTKVSDDVIKAYRGVFKNSGLTNKIFKDIKLKEEHMKWIYFYSDHKTLLFINDFDGIHNLNT